MSSRGPGAAGLIADRLIAGRLVAFAIARRRLLLGALAAGTGLLTHVEPTDAAIFAPAGGQILSGRWGSVYRNMNEQAGPLQLVANRLLHMVSHGGHPLPGILALLDVGLVLGAMGACRGAGDRSPNTRREFVVGFCTLMWLIPNGLWSGHPFELAIPLLWIFAAHRLRRQRWRAAAIALGAGVAFAPWAVLAFPCVLIAERVSIAVRAAAAASVVGVAFYLPFVLTGHFAMFARRWPVDPASIAHLLDPHIALVGWGLRVIQAIVVGAGCAYVARRYRHHPMIAALAPLTVALLRIATDPLQFDYYWVPAGACAIIALALAPADLGRRLGGGALLLVYLTWAAHATGWTTYGYVTGLAALLFVLSGSTTTSPSCSAERARSAAPARSTSGH